MVRYDKYLWYVIRHKWFVFIECCRYGLFWRGIKHDWSKFLPSEFIPYARHFYGPKPQKRDETGYYKPTDTGDPAFDFAWLLHQKRNRHHWQWWILPEDDGGEKVMPMGFCDVLEMIADWRGAGKAQGAPDTLKWYTKNKDKMRLDRHARIIVEHEIGYGPGPNQT